MMRVHWFLLCTLALVSSLKAQPYDPRLLPSLQAWYRADLGAVTNGARVTHLVDHSGRGRNLGILPYVEGTTQDQQPVLVPNALNGLPVLKFDGQNDTLYPPTLYPWGAPVNMRKHTVFIVYREVNRTPGGGILGWRNHALGDASSTGDYAMKEGVGTNGLGFAQNSTLGVVYRANATGTPISTETYGGQNFHVATFGFSTNLFLRRNGQHFAVSTVAPDEGDLLVDLFVLSALTAPPSGVGPYGANEIAEVLIFNDALSVTEIQSAEAYLMTKYGFPDPGPLKLISARRSYLQKNRILATFGNGTAQTASATRNRSYRIFPSVPISSVVAGPTPNTFLITTQNELNDGAEYRLFADDVLDSSGKAMYLTNANVRIDVSPAMPVEIHEKKTVSGFLDDFNGGTLHAAWVPVGDRRDLYRASHGYLRVQSGGSGPHYLTLKTETPYDPVQQGVLARIQVNRFSGAEARAGFGFGINGQGEGIASVLREGLTGEGVFSAGKDGAAPQIAPLFWQKQTWYWLRVTNAPGKVEVKLWPADLDTLEPDTWTTLSHDPNGATQGLAGIAAGTEAGLSDYKIDWILVQSPGLPPVQVAGPELFAPFFTARWQGTDLVFEWAQEIPGMWVQFNPMLDPLDPWTGWDYLEEPHLGEGYYQVILPDPPSPTFFRLGY